MATGKEAFESACQIGVAKTYNYRQLSQIFHGIDQAFNSLEVSGIGNIVISGSVPDGEENGQIGFFQGSDGNYYEYIWVDSEWKNVKTQNEDVTIAGSAPFITISGTQLSTQRDINHYINDRIDALVLDPSGEPIDLAPYATIVYSDEEDQKLSVEISGVQADVAELEQDLSYVETNQINLTNRVSQGEVNQQHLTGRVDQLEVTRGADKLYDVHAVTTDLATRAGEIVFNNADATLVSFISLALFDKNDNASPLVGVGDIIDIEVDGATNRYQVAQGTSELQSIQCNHISGDTIYSIGQTLTVYIYPQNSANYATTEYVDDSVDTCLRLTGGTITGNVLLDGGGLYVNQLVKSVRTSGYAFQVQNQGSDVNKAFIHTNGNGRFAEGVFTGDVEIRGTSRLVGNVNTEGHIFTTGSLRLDKGNNKNFQIYPNGNADEYGVTLYSYNNGFFKIRLAEGDTQSPYKEIISCTKGDHTVGGITHPVGTQISWIKTPTLGHHAANKEYCDDKFAAATSNGMRWQHATHETAANLAEGEFFVANNGNIYLHGISYDGVDLFPSSTATDVTGMKQIATVHRPNGDSAYHITWNAIGYNNSENKYIRITKEAVHLGDSTTPGEIYRLNIPGFTF